MKTLLTIVGPTAIGKTALAIELARQHHTHILSCDSRQFYHELNIGVARPSPQELAAAPHHFIACRSVASPYNAYTFGEEALSLLNNLFLRHDVVVAVGGSGLYIDALCQGIALLPDPSPDLRRRLSDQISSQGLTPLQQQLKELDPEYYAVCDIQNPVRVQRALETILTAHCPYSQLLRQQETPRTFQVRKIGLFTDRDTLRHRIDIRVDQMMEQGLLDEVRRLLPFRHLNTLNTVGYKELFPIVESENSTPSSLLAAVNAIKINTWHYAKKQITWLKRYPEISWQEVGKK